MDTICERRASERCAWAESHSVCVEILTTQFSVACVCYLCGARAQPSRRARAGAAHVYSVLSSHVCPTRAGQRAESSARVGATQTFYLHSVPARAPTLFFGRLLR